jgi:hypothetical protein
MKIKSILLITMFIITCLPIMARSYLLPDTGQTQSLTDTFGEDSDYTINPPSYTDLGNGVVLDNNTGLMWQRATAPGYYTWDQAHDYCYNLVLGNYDDWHLPTAKELESILDYEKIVQPILFLILLDPHRNTGHLQQKQTILPKLFL